MTVRSKERGVSVGPFEDPEVIALRPTFDRETLPSDTGALVDVTGGMTLHPRPQRHNSVRELL